MSFKVGSLVEGKVVDIVKFGVFVRIKGGKTGLVHISRISNEFVRKTSDFVSINEKIVAKILSIDDRERIQLSIKDVTDAESAEFLELSKEKLQEQTPAKEESLYSEDKQRPDKNSGENFFEEKLKSFMHQSEGRLTDLKRSKESKRGGSKKRK